MATRSIPLPAGVWTEVTASNMVDDSQYAVEIVGAPGEARDVNGANRPLDDDRGHPWFPGTARRPADYRTFSKVAGATWWWRPFHEGAHLIVSDL